MGEAKRRAVHAAVHGITGSAADRGGVMAVGFAAFVATAKPSIPPEDLPRWRDAYFAGAGRRLNFGWKTVQRDVIEAADRLESQASDLIALREENARLREDVADLEARLDSAGERLMGEDI